MSSLILFLGSLCFLGVDENHPLSCLLSPLSCHASTVPMDSPLVLIMLGVCVCVLFKSRFIDDRNCLLYS